MKISRLWALPTLALFLMLLPACTQVSREQVVSWREAVVAAREQSVTSFQATNALIREDQLARVVKHAEITESDFTPGLDSTAIARWMAAMDAMTVYASAVDRLLAPELPAGVGESLRKTGEQIAVTAKAEALGSDKELSKAIGSLGQLLVAAYAQDSAQKIMLQTDPAITNTLTRMADMLYVEVKLPDSAQPVAGGIAVTVADAWDNKRVLLERKYKSETTEQGRLSVAREYLETLDRKSASLEAIRSLRISLIQLAAAHTAAAQGRTTDLQSVIASIRAQVQNVKLVLDAAKPAASK